MKRHGYDIRALSESLDVKPAEIRSFFWGRLSSGRAQELENEIFKYDSGSLQLTAKKQTDWSE
jgi:hypothetical protein